MKKISLSEEFKTIFPKIELTAISADVKYEKYNPKLWNEINTETQRIEQLDAEKIKQIPPIFSTRQAYKKLGKEPSRYRPSAEALYRRLTQKKGMYQINNLVDTINLISLKTGYSIGGYDEEKISGNITLKKANNSDKYHAIGRGNFNINNLPVFFDEKGPFGSPTSDSERTKITDTTKKILLIIIKFEQQTNCENKVENKIKKYCYGKNIIKVKVKGTSIN